MTSKRLDIMEFHWQEGRHLKKYTLIDCSIDLPIFLATLLFYYFTLYDMMSVAILVLQMSTKLQYFMGKKNNFSYRLTCSSVRLGS